MRVPNKTSMSSKSSSQTISSGMGFSGWLTILFIGLKLTGHITWPWVWVLSTLWISLLIGLSFLDIVVVIAILADVWK